MMIRRSTVIISLCAWTVALPSLALAQRVILPQMPAGDKYPMLKRGGPPPLLLCADHADIPCSRYGDGPDREGAPVGRRLGS